MSEKSPEDKGYAVHDRRRFASVLGNEQPVERANDASSSGEAAGPAQTQDPGGASGPARTQDPGGVQGTRRSAPRNVPLPEIDFSTFILSLATSALMHLGEVPHPDTNGPVVNLPLAKQTIDIIGMLREKTRGNLSPDELQLLDNLLCDLRMKYVCATHS